jgi:flavin-binding protein dodecin
MRPTPPSNDCSPETKRAENAGKAAVGGTDGTGRYRAGHRTLGVVPENGGFKMESTYKVVELVGTSPDSWERAAAVALEDARKSLRDLRVAEVEALDIHLSEGGEIIAYRTKLKVSFKYED